jgi:PAS domain S-box-containing protein
MTSRGAGASREIEELRLRLAEAEQTLEAIRAGEVDSLVVEAPDGLRVYALESVSNSYRVLIEAMNEGAATLNVGGVILYSNGQLARMLGIPLERVMGSALHDFVPPRFHDTLDALLRSAGDGESRSELTLLAGEEEVPAYLSLNAIQDEGRRVLCLVATDLRGQKRSEEIVAAERLARSVLEQAAEAIVVCDRDGRVIRASRAAAELCGRNPLLASFEEAFPITLGGDARGGGAAAAALGGETLRAAPATLARGGGDPAELLVSAAPLQGADGRVIGCVISMVDVTEHRRVEAALREADRRKNEFLAMLSHELRNPLAPIKNSLHVLARAAPGGDQALRAQAIIERQVGQLSRLVDDLLDVTRISHNRIELKRERLELNDLVHRTIEDYRSLFEQSGVRLETEDGPSGIFVSGDWARLAQVIGNLLQNAAKFTPRGGSARITVAREPDGRWATIRVADSGAGMASEMLSHIFEPFTQADRTLDRSKGGLGLGLALVKGIVEMHGGEVSARSEGDGKGAEFTVRLAVDDSAERHPAVFTSRLRNRRKILVIEDNVDAAASLREVLELAGHEVEVAHEGATGMTRARELFPDLVLCDIGLPGMDGYAVASAFRSDPELARTHLVAVSGYARPEDLERAAAAGFERHIVKPLSVETLDELLSSL